MSEEIQDKDMELVRRGMKIINLMDEVETLRGALEYAKYNNPLSDMTTKVVDQALKGERHSVLDAIKEKRSGR